MQGSTGNGVGGVLAISRRVVFPEPPPLQLSVAPETIHLTAWDLRMLKFQYIQHAVLLPKPKHQPAAGLAVVDHLASAFARAVGRFHPFAGRLVLGEIGADGVTATVSLRCTGEGAEFVHAAAPGVTAADIASAAPLCVPRELVSSLFPLNGLLNADAVSPDGDCQRRAPLLAAQVTELADAVFVAVSLNHAVGDGAAFWHFVNTWSDLSRSGGAARNGRRQCWSGGPTPAAPCRSPCSSPRSSTTVKKLKSRANAEVHDAGAGTAAATATVSSLQALLAHLWRSVCRARRLEPPQETNFLLSVGCRGKVTGVPATGDVGNAVVGCRVTLTAGEVQAKGLGGTAWLLNRAVAALDEPSMVSECLAWMREQRFPSTASARTQNGVNMFTGSHGPRSTRWTASPRSTRAAAAVAPSRWSCASPRKPWPGSSRMKSSWTR
ncbi:hypothetical protein ACP70R_033478 [Stipagrostis hirtigluma subsp. patula]